MIGRRYGHVVSADTRAKISRSLLGRRLPEEHKSKIRANTPRGEKCYRWKGGLPSCSCGKTLSCYEAKRCRSCHLVIMRAKGENHYNYKRDRNKIAMSNRHADANYNIWKKAVKIRDGWKCRINNSDCSGELEAHHILGWSEHPELRYEMKNGITLCHFHHPRKKIDQQKLIPVFRGLLSNVY